MIEYTCTVCKHTFPGKDWNDYTGMYFDYDAALVPETVYSTDDIYDNWDECVHICPHCGVEHSFSYEVSREVKELILERIINEAHIDHKDDQRFVRNLL